MAPSVFFELGFGDAVMGRVCETGRRLPRHNVNYKAGYETGLLFLKAFPLEVADLTVEGDDLIIKYRVPLSPGDSAAKP